MRVRVMNLAIAKNISTVVWLITSTLCHHNSMCPGFMFTPIWIKCPWWQLQLKPTLLQSLFVVNTIKLELKFMLSLSSSQCDKELIIILIEKIRTQWPSRALFPQTHFKDMIFLISIINLLEIKMSFSSPCLMHITMNCSKNSSKNKIYLCDESVFSFIFSAKDSQH